MIAGYFKILKQKQSYTKNKYLNQKSSLEKYKHSEE